MALSNLQSNQNDLGDVEDLLTNTLGPEGSVAHLLSFPSTNRGGIIIFQFDPNDVVHLANDPSGDISEVEFKLPVLLSVPVVSSPGSFDIGIPGLGLSTNGVIGQRIGRRDGYIGFWIRQLDRGRRWFFYQRGRDEAECDREPQPQRRGKCPGHFHRGPRIPKDHRHGSSGKPRRILKRDRSRSRN